MVLNFKVTQSNVKDDFRMPVPIYLELADGTMAFSGPREISGSSSFEQKVPLKG